MPSVLLCRVYAALLSIPLDAADLTPAGGLSVLPEAATGDGLLGLPEAAPGDGLLGPPEAAPADGLLGLPGAAPADGLFGLPGAVPALFLFCSLPFTSLMIDQIFTA